MLKKYLRENTSQDDIWLWYMGSSDQDILEMLIADIENKWRNLDKKELIVRVFSEKPELLMRSNYSDLRSFVIREFKCWGPVKDVFTAGGREKNRNLPKIFATLLKNLPEVKRKLERNSDDIRNWKKLMEQLIKSKVGKKKNSNGLTQEQSELLLHAVLEI